jgi:hypothetical protein
MQYTEVHTECRKNEVQNAVFQNNIPYTERKDLVPDNLEMTCVEITRQHSKPLLTATWYRPPNSELDIFTNFELFLFKCDMENKARP